MKVGKIRVNMYPGSTIRRTDNGMIHTHHRTKDEVLYWALYVHDKDSNSLQYIGVFTMEKIKQYLSNILVQDMHRKYDAYGRLSKTTRGRNGKYRLTLSYGNIYDGKYYGSTEPQKLYKNYKDALRRIHSKYYDCISAEILDTTTGEVHYMIHKEGGVLKDEFRNDPHPRYTTNK